MGARPTLFLNRGNFSKIPVKIKQQQRATAVVLCADRRAGVLDVEGVLPRRALQVLGCMRLCNSVGKFRGRESSIRLSRLCRGDSTALVRRQAEGVLSQATPVHRMKCPNKKAHLLRDGPFRLGRLAVTYFSSGRAEALNLTTVCGQVSLH